VIQFSADVAIIFYYYYFNDFFYIYKKKKLWGWLSHPFGPHEGGWPPHFGQGGGLGHFGDGRTTPMALGGGQNHPHLAWGWLGLGVSRPPSRAKMGVAGFLFIFYLFIYIKEIIKIIIIKNDNHVSAELYHGDRCRACTPTPVG
jgi:hypothetical protein